MIFVVTPTSIFRDPFLYGLQQFSSVDCILLMITWFYAIFLSFGYKMSKKSQIQRDSNKITTTECITKFLSNFKSFFCLFSLPSEQSCVDEDFILCFFLSVVK